MRHPGEVWFLPPDAVEGGDAKGRRHVLLTRCEEANDDGIFAYASTKDTEAAFGAACLLLDPSLTHYGRAGRTGFDRVTYIYPSRLVSAGADEMRRMVGRLINELAELRVLLRKALGIGAGTSSGSVDPANWRGTVIRFAEPVRREIDCSHGLIITEPLYSSQQRYQLVVPVLDLNEFESTGTDVVVEEKEWLSLISGDSAPVAFAVDMLQTVFHPTDIEARTSAVVDADTVSRIDRRLLQLLDL